MSSTAIQVKNQQKTISTEEKLDVISKLEKGNEMLAHVDMLGSFIVQYIQFVVTLTDLNKVLSV
jgi:hypothetical protein